MKNMIISCSVLLNCLVKDLEMTSLKLNNFKTKSKPFSNNYYFIESRKEKIRKSVNASTEPMPKTIRFQKSLSISNQELSDSKSM